MRVLDQVTQTSHQSTLVRFTAVESGPCRMLRSHCVSVSLLHTRVHALKVPPPQPSVHGQPQRQATRYVNPRSATTRSPVYATVSPSHRHRHRRPNYCETECIMKASRTRCRHCPGRRLPAVAPRPPIDPAIHPHSAVSEPGLYPRPRSNCLLDVNCFPVSMTMTNDSGFMGHD